MRKLLPIAIALMVCLVAGHAFAWELNMTGRFMYQYRYATQLGTNGFFGPYDVDSAGMVGAGTGNQMLNFWHGRVFDARISAQGWGIAREIGSSSDTSTRSLWVEIKPELRINKAVKVRGAYRIGSLRGIDNTALYASDFPGLWNEFSDGQWTQLWVSAETPWGIVVLGKRPLAFGMGLAFDGTDDYGQLSWDSVAFITDYGPLRFLIGLYPGLNLGDLGTASKVDRWDYAAAAFYSSGPLQIGNMWLLSSVHLGPELGGFFSTDAWSAVQSTYIKYNNGRFFFNAEYFNEWAADTIRSVTKLYVEGARAAIEAGFMAGPTKVSNLLAWVDGGVWGDTIYGTRAYPNGTVFSPYSLLFVRNYGSGVGSFTEFNQWEGNLSDAYFLGVRVDQSLAANLNAWCAFSAAWRASLGRYRWGYVRPFSVGPTFDGTVTHQMNTNLPPPIPNDDLGWEIYAGFDWQLLEGFRLTNEFAYYQPGQWYKHACRSLTNPNWWMDNPALVQGWGIDWDRSIDPVFAWLLTVRTEF